MSVHPELSLIHPSFAATLSNVRQLVVPTAMTRPPAFFVSLMLSAVPFGSI